MFPDGELRPDMLTAEDLRQYHTVILPDCRFLTEAQTALLSDYLNQGGNLLVSGELGIDLPAARRDAILRHPGTQRLEQSSGAEAMSLLRRPQAATSGGGELAIHIQRVEGGAAIHIIRYVYDCAADRVPVLDEICLDLHLLEGFDRIAAFSPAVPPEASIEAAGGLYHIRLKGVPLYTIVLLSRQE